MTAGFTDEPLIDAEPVPDTDAFADRRDIITWQNQAVREAVKAERERIRELALERGATWVHCEDCGPVPFADLIEETDP